MLVAASNHQELLDPAVWRRFEMHVEFDLPELPAVKDAILQFLGNGLVGDGNPIDAAWVTTLAWLLHGQSFSDIERELKALRREAILDKSTLQELFPRLVQRHIEGQSKSAKKEIALKLSAAGLSQRMVNELTGLSRDTIRKIAPGVDPPTDRGS